MNTDLTPHPPSHDTENGHMGFLEHLVELRTRVIHSLVAILVIFLGMVFFANDIYSIFAKPLTSLLPPDTSMIATDIAAPFLAPFKLVFILSFFVAMPYILHQVWQFVSPGLYAHEKKVAVPLLFSSVLLFYAGIAFAYFVVTPLIMAFLTTSGPADVKVAPDISSYLNMALKLFLAFGLTFEIPVATLLLIASGITDAQSLKEKRPYVIVGCFIVGMLLTPPDVLSQTLLALPMWGLFEVGLLFARFVQPKEQQDTP